MNAFLSFSGSENCDGEAGPDSRFWDELSHVGLPQDLDVQSLFESGESVMPATYLCALVNIVWVHHRFVMITLHLSLHFRAVLGTSELCLVV